MKRHPALQDLSRDHYFVLVRCQEIRKAVARNDAPAAFAKMAQDFVRFFESDMRAHFQEEDDFVVPEAREAGDARLASVAEKIRDEHAWFRTIFDDLRASADPGTLLRTLEPQLTAHVREEEEQLFEGLQAALSDAELEDMWRRSFAFRKAHRAPAACSVKPPATH